MTSSEQDRRPDFHEMVRDLTSTHQHRERYDYDAANGSKWATWHNTEVPALVLQLVGASPAGSESMSGSPPASRPAARIEAIDTVMVIDQEAGEWLDRLGQVIPADRIDAETQHTVSGSGTLASVRRLGGLYRSTPHCGTHVGVKDANGRWCCTRHHLESDVRHWWHQARIITGWDTAAFRPHNSCPVCEAHDSLRIKADAALCIECRSVWAGADQLGILAQHIRAENRDEQASA